MTASAAAISFSGRDLIIRDCVDFFWKSRSVRNILFTSRILSVIIKFLLSCQFFKGRISGLGDVSQGLSKYSITWFFALEVFLGGN